MTAAEARVDADLEVEISECCLDTDADIAGDDAWAILSEAERARATRFVFGRDEARYVRGRGHLRRRLGAFLGLAPAAVPIREGAHGKPLVDGGGAQFNLSNSGSRAVLAITSGAEVGIDLETLDRTHSLVGEIDGLSRMVLGDDERRALDDAPPAERARRFLSYWTAKEARMKLTGEGLALDPLDISLELAGGQPIGYRRPASPMASLRFLRLSQADAVCCLAIGGADGRRATIVDGRR